jgi:hypothetical protein
VFYEQVPETKISDDLYAFLARAKTVVALEKGGFETVRFRLKPADVEAVMKCLKAGLGLEATRPLWLRDRPEGMPEALAEA